MPCRALDADSSALTGPPSGIAAAAALVSGVLPPNQPPLPWTERLYGAFERFVPLPDGAVLDKAAAEFKDGVLTVTVPLGNPPKVEAKTLLIG